MAWDSIRDSPLRVESGTKNFRAEFCVGACNVLNTIGLPTTGPRGAGRTVPGTDLGAVVPIPRDPISLSIGDECSNGVAGAGATWSGMLDCDSICIPRQLKHDSLKLPTGTSTVLLLLKLLSDCQNAHGVH